MPKRSATSPDDSPRKLVRKSSRSPTKVATPEDSALTNISDEEIEVAPSVAKPAVPAVYISLKEINDLRETFFALFQQGIATEEPPSLDVQGYKTLISQLPEEDPSERRFLVDQYMRDFIVERILSNRDKWSQFLELSINLAREEICTASLPIALISDLIELSSLQDCEGIFQYVEKRLNVWKEPLFLNSGKNAVLRMCNDLLRRLSRAQNTIFCGRILIFLANYFPFSERSGLNIMSEFNADNVTAYKSGDGSDDPEDKMEIVEEHDEKLFEGMDITIPGLDTIVSISQEEKKKKVKVDYNLYVKFWSLQDFFRNPMQCYNKIAWKTFTLYTQDVLGAFTCFKIDNSGSRSSRTGPIGHGHGHSAINVIPKLGDDDLYFPKYLTNRRLLELQMGDPSFRRYFMVQLLIILQYLTTAIKFKSESQVLSDDQLDFVKKTTEKIYSLLKELRPGGKEFVKAVQHMLKREELWSKWKNDGCQAFKKPAPTPVNVESSGNSSEVKDSKDDSSAAEPVDKIPASGEKMPPKRRHLGDIIEDADNNNRFLLGNPELTRLWNICGDNLEACRSGSRDFLPTIENFFSEAFKELDPEPTPPAVLADPSKREVKEKKLLGNPNFGWRALRLLARNSPFFFQLQQSPPIQPLQNYLEYILKKIAAELEVAKEEGQDGSKIGNESKESDATPGHDTTNTNEGEQVVVGGEDENDELLKPDLKDEQMEEEEEGEVDEKVRNLTEQEQKAVGNRLGAEWKKVASKLQFTNDEIEYFETEKGKDAGSWMLKMWTEQEKDDATVADLLYQLEGLQLRQLLKDIFP